MIRARTALFFACLSSVIACDRGVKMEHHELPGFAIDLPSGTEIPGYTNLEYANGSIGIQDAEHGRIVMMQWSVGTKLGGTELDAMLSGFRAIVKTSGSAARIVDPWGPGPGSGIETMKIDAEPFPFYLNQVECAGRDVVIVSGAAHDADTLRHAIVTSLRCKPDPVAEKKLGEVAVEIQIELPGWHVLSKDEGQLMLQNDTGSIAMIEPMGVMDHKDFMTAVGPMLQQAFKGTVIVGAVEGDLVPLSGTLEGTTVIGVSRMIKCGKKSTLVIQLSPSRTLADQLRPVIEAAKCLAPGQAPPTWPAQPTEPAAPATE